MQRHYGCIRQLESMFYIQLEDPMLLSGLAAVSFEHDINWSQSLAILVNDSAAELEDECGAGYAERISWSIQRVIRRRWRAQPPVQHARGADLALKCGAIDCGLQIA